MNNLSPQDLVSISCQRNSLEAENRKYTMKIRCAWCRGNLGTKPCDAASDGKVTDGICLPCKDKYFPMQSA